MAWYRTGRASSVAGSNVITGVGTLWANNVFGIAPGQTLSIPGAGQVLQYEILAVDSDTKIRIATNATTTINNSEYAIVTTVANSYSALARQTSANLAVYEKLLSDWNNITTGTGNVTILAPDGTQVIMPSLNQMSTDINNKLPLSGGIMEGPIVLSGDATAVQNPVSFGQLTGVVGTTRNFVMNTGQQATAGVSADEIIVQTALGGLQYKLSAFNKVINLAAVGLNGMNAGTVPANGYVAIYAIYNPTTKVSGLLAVDCSNIIAPEICAVAMPSGFTASALVSIQRTSASYFVNGRQQDRTVYVFPASFVNGTGFPSDLTIGLSQYCPRNTKSVYLEGTINSPGSNNTSLITSPIIGNALGRMRLQYSTGLIIQSYWVPVVDYARVVYLTGTGGGTAAATSYTVYVNGYTF